MGIHGLLREIGPAPRSSLAALSAAHYTTHSRPLILAIDIAIWLFQIQSGRGGSNPALRTFYYRLLRLLSLNIHPLFVFDGPNKPLFKRNKKVGGPGVRVASVPEFLAKQLLKQFGFPWHVAPGEAEAECAMLQQVGVVDAVLSEDVDTLMFGSGVTFRNWGTGDGVAQSNKTPTHVSVYREQETRQRSRGIDREGMILVALMSGGDYLPEGISGCGPKVACDAARAGFGAELCALRRSDAQGLRDWKERLQHEIRTNESKFFSRKNNSFTIPEDFPNQEVLGYYTHPCVSTPEKVARLRAELRWDQDIDFAALRAFAGDAFDWRCVGGAKKFIKNLAPALLVRQLRMRGEGATSLSQEAQEETEGALVRAVHGKRNHASVDNEPELRISFIPASLVPINLDDEDEDDEFLPAGGEGETDNESEFAGMPPPSTADVDEDDEDGQEAGGVAKRKRVPRPFDPELPEKIWLLRTWVQVGCPLLVEEYEAGLRDPKDALKQRRKAKGAATTDNIHAPAKKKSGKKKKGEEAAQPAENALTRHLKVTKAGVQRDREPLAEKTSSQSNSQDAPPSNAPAGGIADDALDRFMGLKMPATQSLEKRLAEEKAKSRRAVTPPARQEEEVECEAVDLTAATPRPFAAFVGKKANVARHERTSSSDGLLDLAAPPAEARPFAMFAQPTVGAEKFSNSTKTTTTKAKANFKAKPFVSQNVQRTPQRRKRRSAELSSPAVPCSQRTIKHYWSPSPRKHQGSSLFPGATIAADERSRLLPGAGAVMEDKEIVDLVSSSPVKLSNMMMGVERERRRSLTPTLRRASPRLRNVFVRSPSPAPFPRSTLFERVADELDVPESPPRELLDTVTRRRGKRPLKRAKTAPVFGAEYEEDEALDLTMVEADVTVIEAMDLAGSSPVRPETHIYGELDGGGFLLDEDGDDVEAGTSLLRYSPEPEPPVRQREALPTFRERLLGGSRTVEVADKVYPTPPTTASNDAARTGSANMGTAPAKAAKDAEPAAPTTTTASSAAFDAFLVSKTKPRPKSKLDASSAPAHTRSPPVRRSPRSRQPQSPPTAIRRSPRQAQKKRVIVPRESLPGSWKEMPAEMLDMTEDGSGWKATGGKATIVGTGTRVEVNVKRFRKSEVEVLDMTGA